MRPTAGPRPRPVRREASATRQHREAVAKARGERSPADLHEDPVESGPSIREPTPTPGAAISQPMVRPPSRHPRSPVPCTVNGIGAAVDRVANRSIAGSPGGRRAIVHIDGCPPLTPRGDQRRARWPCRYEDLDRPATAALARVAAARAALPHEAIASGGRLGGRRGDRAPDHSAASRCSRIVIRWRALWLPATWRSRP